MENITVYIESKASQLHCFGNISRMDEGNKDNIRHDMGISVVCRKKMP